MCSRLPLLNILGYEFSAAIAVVSSLLAGTGTAHAVARHASGERRHAVLRLIVRTGASYVGLLLIPMAVICANALAVRNCSWSDGLLFFLLLPVVSVLFSTSLGGFCGLHYRHPRSAFLVLVMLSFVYALALGYWTPAVFSYNFFYGYFPGLTYDEALVPDRTLILFRLVTLVAGGVVLWMAMLLARTTQAGQSTTQKGKALIEALVSPRRLPATLLMVAAAALLYAWRGPLGFEAPAGFVRGARRRLPDTPLHHLLSPSASLG